MPSQFGGEPITESKSKFGGVPVEEEEKPGAFKTIGSQFLAGLHDITGFISKPLSKTFGDIVVGPNGIEILSPEEATAEIEAGGIGIPGMATQEPTDVIGKGSRFAGQTAAIGPILGRMFGLVRAPAAVSTAVPAGQAGGTGVLGQQLAHTIGKTFAKAPLTSTAIETGLGFTAGAGGGIANEIFPGSDVAEFTGQVIGGTAPALTPTGLLLRSGRFVRGLYQRARHQFTDKGGFERAAARAGRAAPPEQRVKALEELKKETTIGPDGKPVLTPSQRTGDEGLLSLERAVQESSETLKRGGDQQIAQANKVIQDSLSDLGKAPSQSAFVPIVEAHNYLDNLLNTRIRIAAQATDERIAALGPKVTLEQSNLIAREELQGALDAAVTQQRELYALIPEKTAVPFRATENAFINLRSDLGRAQQSDIPEVAKQFLSKGSRDYFGKHRPSGFKTGETEIKELRSLQSKLRAEARNARAGDKKNLNMARIADDIADAIDDDLMNAAAGPEVSDAISTAVNFSRNLNERFNKGKMGEILGRTVTGGQRVAPGLTLEHSIGMTGPKARQSLDELLKVFDSPEAPGNQLITGAVEDYVRTRFIKSAVERGNLNMNAARRFIKNNEEMLTRLPGLRRQLDEVVESGEALALTQRQRARIMLDDPRVSKATFLIEKGPEETFRQIGKLKPQDAATETQKLINMVSRDQSGEALEGLKSGFVEMLYSQAKTAKRDATGRMLLSGYALRDALETPGIRSAANRLFSGDELNRLGVITRDLIRLEKRLAAPIPLEGVIGDRPSKLIETMAGIAGAAVGRSQARRLGIGGTVQIPGIMANRFRDMIAAGVQDPAGRLLRDMVYDEALFKELLEAPLLEGGTKLTPEATRRLNAWAFNVIAEHGGAYEIEE